MSRRLSLLLLVPVALVLVGYVLLPAWETVRLSIEDGTLWQLFEDGTSSAAWRGLVTSVGVSLVSVLLSGILGTGLAFAFYRFDFPMRRLLGTAALVPLALPPLVGVLAFLFLYGESGILPRLIQTVLGLDEVPFAFEGLSAVVIVHVYAFYVYFFLFVGAGFESLDASLLEASSDLGAPGWTTFRRVVLPALGPALLSASLLVFMVSMASFTAPLLFANGEEFLTLQIYRAKTNGDLALSASVSVLLTSICLVFLLALELRRSGNIGSGTKGVGSRARPLRSGWQRVLAGSLTGLFLLLLALPILTVILISFAEEGSWTYQLVPERYTFANYTSLFSDPNVLAPIRNSLLMATMATVGNVLFGVVAALLITKGRVRGRLLLRILTVLPFAIPGTVIALNLIIAFNEPSVWTGGTVLVGAFLILPLAYFVRHIPLVVRSTISSLETYDDQLTEASSDLGASFATTFRRVIGPFIAPGVLAGTLLTFVTALGEFVSSIMLYVFSNRPISVEILSQLRLYEFGGAAAYSVFLMILIALSAGLTASLRSRGRVARETG